MGLVGKAESLAGSLAWMGPPPLGMIVASRRVAPYRQVLDWCWLSVIPPPVVVLGVRDASAVH